MGIPKALHYYYYKELWEPFFKKLDIDLIISPDTNPVMLDNGTKLVPDEMCLSMKLYFGHLVYLADKCDYILIPRIDRFDNDNQTCTNFLAIYDLASKLFDTKILNFNIDNDNNMRGGLFKIGKELGFSSKKVTQAYKYAIAYYKYSLKQKEIEQSNKLLSDRKKVLLISHPYNTYDSLIGKPIIKLFEDNDINIIYCDAFNIQKTNTLALKLSPNLYWKYSRDQIGSILLSDKVDGFLFLSSFPCGLDSLVNELVMRKLNKPYLNLVVDDNTSLAGVETRVESFIDVIN